MFYVSIDSSVPKQKRFSVRRETLRQIIHADIEEDKLRLQKEYDFLNVKKKKLRTAAWL